MADKNINDVNETLTKFVTQLTKAESVSSKIEGISKSIKSQFGELAQKNAVVGLVFSKMTSQASAKSREMTEIQQLLTKALVQQNNVMSRRDKLMEVQLKIQTEIQKAASNPATNRPEVLNPLQKALDSTNVKIKNLDRGAAKLGQQIDFLRNVAGPAASSIVKLGDATKAISAGAFLTGFAQLLTFSNDLNRAVIQTNANLSTRQQLLQASLDTQISTGASSKTLLDINREMASIGARILDSQMSGSAEAMKLVRASEQTSKSYRETLAVANELVEGLGMSVKETVQLQITARLANLTYREMGNTISKITAATGLAADEAARYARELLVASKIAVGNNAKFDDKVYKQNLVALAGIEGAMKDSIGVQGEISEMMTRFSSFRKSGGMGMAFGTGGIDFLQKQGNGATKVLENIGRAVQGMSGPMLEAYADMTGLSPQTLIALGEEFKKAQAAGMSFAQFYAKRQELFAADADLQERYNKQLALQGETFSRLGRVLVVLAGSALAPLLQGLNWLSIKLMGLFKLIGPEGPLGPIASWLKTGFALVATGFLVTRLWDTTKALFAFTASLVRLSTQLKANAIEGALAGATKSISTKGGGGVAKEIVKDAAQTSILQKILQVVTFGRFGGAKTAVGKAVSATGEVITKTEVSGLTGFFKNVVANSKGFFSKIFGKAASTAAGETLASTASKSILSRLLGGLASFFGGTLLRTVGGALLRVLIGLIGGLPGLIISIVLVVLPLLWPKIKSLFGGGEKTKGVGVNLSNDDLQKKAIAGFTKGMVENNGQKLAISEKAYQALIKSQGKTPEQLDELNRNIISALNQKIDVQSGAHQRAQGIDPAKDVENAKALSDQIKTLGELSSRLDEFSKNYKAAETAKKKAQAEKEEEAARIRLQAMSQATMM